MALYDIDKAAQNFAAGVYITDGSTLWRILDLEEKRKGMVPLEDCRFPDCEPTWRKVEWLMAHKAKVVQQGR